MIYHNALMLVYMIEPLNIVNLHDKRIHISDWHNTGTTKKCANSLGRPLWE